MSTLSGCTLLKDLYYDSSINKNKVKEATAKNLSYSYLKAMYSAEQCCNILYGGDVSSTTTDEGYLAKPATGHFLIAKLSGNYYGRALR